MRSVYRVSAAFAVAALTLTACGGGAGGVGPTTNPTPTPTSTVSSVLTCPASGSLPSSVAVGRRRIPVARVKNPGVVSGTLAVTYTHAADLQRLDRIAASMQGSRVSDLAFNDLGLRSRIVHVDPDHVNEAIAQLKRLPGVRSVSPVGYRARMTIVTNDPYYGGFGASSPYFETATTPGQWDMHVTNVEAAWNAVASSAPVVGSNAPIAIVDTGVDVTHPELSAGVMVRTQCFVTYPEGTTQTKGTYVTDTDGHGTNVAGIAAGDTDNGLGFASVSYDAKILAYRIFPSDPAGGCDLNNPPAQCFSDSSDEAAAIDDAVSNGAKVINLSLGGSQPCSTGDPEYIAVENAIKHNVVVVAAAGNGDPDTGMGLPQLDCPANDPGVIAVGASAVDDSLPNTDVQYVASYSNYLTNGGNGYYLVAPGGDPSGGSDADELHWIQHIYSSTAVEAGDCGVDWEAASSVDDCKIDIAGTSQATPHVAGAVALILSVKPNYTPAQVAQALCKSAADIQDPHEGCGQLDVAAAVAYAKAH